MRGEYSAGNDGLLDLDETEARYRLGELDPEEAPDVALRALRAGYEGPALLELARLSEPTARDVGDLFERALGEMGRPAHPREEAGLRVARNVARRILSGDLHPHEGARLIWLKVWSACGRPDELTPFVGLASLYEADPERRPYHLRQILARAQELADEREDR